MTGMYHYHGKQSLVTLPDHTVELIRTLQTYGPLRGPVYQYVRGEDRTPLGALTAQPPLTSCYFEIHA